MSRKRDRDRSVIRARKITEQSSRAEVSLHYRSSRHLCTDEYNYPYFRLVALLRVFECDNLVLFLINR